MKTVSAGRLRGIIEAQRDIMACAPDIDAVMRVSAERAQALTDATAGVVELAEGPELVYRAASGRATEMLGLRLEASRSISGLCVAKREILSSEDTETDPRVDRDACRRVGARSLLVVPLCFEQACIGALKVMSPSPHAFDRSDVAVLELMVGFIACAMNHATSHARLAASERRFRSVADLALDAIATVDAEGRVTFWNESAERLFGYPFEDAIGHPLAAIIPGLEASPPSPSHVGKVAELFGRHRDGSEFPIEVAVSEWSSRGQENYTAIIRDIRERKRLEAAVLDRLRRDELTGLLIRRAGDEVLAHEAERARRYVQPLSIVLLDLDHFKRVNDTYGHNVGDEVLRRVGAAIRRIVRDSDVGVRWGGEELLVLLAETGLEGGVECAERIRRAVAEIAIDGMVHVTLSAGVAALAPEESIDTVIACADAKLYAAKRAGRDQVAS